MIKTYQYVLLVALAIQVVNLSALRPPASIRFQRTDGQHDVGVGIAVTLVMERKVGAHSFCYKIVFDESPNKCQLLRSGQLHGKGNFDFTGKLGVAGFFAFLYRVPKRGTVLKLRRGVGREHDFCMDNTGLVRVVVGLAVPLICQLLAAPVGGSSDSRTAYTPLDNLNGTVKNCYVIFLLPSQSTAGG